MKRTRLLLFSLLLSAAICLLCTGCAGAKENPMALFRDSLAIEARYGEIRFELKTEAENENAVFSFSEPEALTDLTVRVENGDVFAVFGGMETKVTELFPAAVLPLYRAVMAFRGTNDTSAEADGEVYEAFWDGENALSRIEVKEADGELIAYEILSEGRIQYDAESMCEDSSGQDPG